MNEQNNPLIAKGAEHTEEFDHREQDELLLTERDIKEGEVIPVFAGNTEIAISPLYLFRLAKEYGFFEAQLAKVKQHYPIMYREEAELWGWFLEKGWLPPLEVEKLKQHYEQEIGEILVDIEERWGWAFDKQVWQAFKQECLSGRINE